MNSKKRLDGISAKMHNRKGFLAVDYFCHQCLHGFHHKKAYDEHVCQECEDDTLNSKKKKQGDVVNFRANSLENTFEMSLLTTKEFP